MPRKKVVEAIASEDLKVGNPVVLKEQPSGEVIAKKPQPAQEPVAAESIEELDAKIDEALEKSQTPELVTDNSGIKTEFVVTNSSGGYVRTYSIAEQGENAEALAQMFAGKIGGSVA